MATATWKGVVIARTDKFETVEGNVRAARTSTHDSREMGAGG